jgi:hypothetical protein
MRPLGLYSRDVIGIAQRQAFREQCGDTRAPMVAAATTVFAAAPIVWVRRGGSAVCS